jgi:hypothetical protein
LDRRAGSLHGVLRALAPSSDPLICQLAALFVSHIHVSWLLPAGQREYWLVCVNLDDEVTIVLGLVFEKAARKEPW